MPAGMSMPPPRPWRTRKVISDSGRPREAGEDRAAEEQRERQHVQALRAEAVGGPARDRDDGRERERVAGDDPLDRLERRVERRRQVADRDVDDGRVEDRHDRAEDDDDRDAHQRAVDALGVRVGGGGLGRHVGGSVAKNSEATNLRFSWYVRVHERRLRRGSDPQRPLRRDAERNRARILAAAREAFAERGLVVTMDEIARRAGVGVGTVYRRFPEKELLIDALFEQRIDELVALAEAAREPTRTRGPGSCTSSRASSRCSPPTAVSRRSCSAPAHGQERVARARGADRPVVDEPVARAKAEGELRPDVAGPRPRPHPVHARRAGRLDARRRARAVAAVPRDRPRRLRTRRDGADPLRPGPLDEAAARPRDGGLAAGRPGAPARIVLRIPWISALLAPWLAVRRGG